MTVEELKKRDGYEFECNMDNGYRDCKDHDEWGCAYTWLGDGIGVEYNFCMQGENENCCAIYKVEINGKTGYMETDTSVFEHYEIDFEKDNWKEELEHAMCKALIQFFELDKTLVQENKRKNDVVTKVSVFNELLSGKKPVDVCEMVWKDVEKELTLEKENVLDMNESSSTIRGEMIEKWRNIYFEESETMIALLESKEAMELNKAEKEELLRWSGDNEYAYVDEKGKLIYAEEEELEEKVSLDEKINKAEGKKSVGQEKAVVVQERS